MEKNSIRAKSGLDPFFAKSRGNVIEQKLKGLRPDFVLMNSRHQGYDLARVLKILNPKVMIVHHFDDWGVPFSQGIPEANKRRAQRFARDVTAVDNQIKVIIPDFLMTHTLE